MSRFSSEDYDEMFPNQGELWHANLMRAIGGKRGQRDLRTLEAALLSLPEHRLIHGRLAKGNEVCAVAALVLHKRCEKGEDREAVLAELRAATKVSCADCYHGQADHAAGQGVCAGTRGWNPTRPCDCQAFVDSDESEVDDYGDQTVEYGHKAGLTYTLAWRIGSLNDEDFDYRYTPDQRFDAVLAWVRSKIESVEAAS